MYLDTGYQHVNLNSEFIYQDVRRNSFDRFEMESAMLSKTIQKSETKFQRLSTIIGLGLLFLLCSCASSNYGKLETSQEVTKMFDNHQILSDHSYYYSGMQNLPDAIVGIHASYSLKSKMWQQVDFSSFMLRKLIDRMSYVHIVTPRGA